MTPLPPGYSPVPEGCLAAIVTTLEMRAPPPRPPAPARADLSLRRVKHPSLDRYRALFRAVGEDWLWVSRLRLDDDALAAIIHDPRVEVFALRRRRSPPPARGGEGTGVGGDGCNTASSINATHETGGVSSLPPPSPSPPQAGGGSRGQSTKQINIEGRPRHQHAETSTSKADIHDAAEIGLLELDFRVDGACELAFFGVVREAIGTGAAHVMMNHAIARAWSADIARLWVHTCTLDHPGAVRFYRRAGFVAVKYEVEVFPDPRRDGLIRPGAAPHAPMIG